MTKFNEIARKFAQKLLATPLYMVAVLGGILVIIGLFGMNPWLAVFAIGSALLIGAFVVGALTELHAAPVVPQYTPPPSYATANSASTSDASQVDPAR